MVSGHRLVLYQVLAQMILAEVRPAWRGGQGTRELFESNFIQQVVVNCSGFVLVLT